MLIFLYWISETLTPKSACKIIFTCRHRTHLGFKRLFFSDRRKRFNLNHSQESYYTCTNFSFQEFPKHLYEQFENKTTTKAIQISLINWHYWNFLSAFVPMRQTPKTIFWENIFELVSAKQQQPDAFIKLWNLSLDWSHLKWLGSALLSNLGRKHTNLCVRIVKGK